LARSPLRHDRLPEGPWLPRLALPSLLQGAGDSWQEFMSHAERVVVCAGWCKEVLVRNGVPTDRIVVLRQGLPGPTRRRRLWPPAVKGRPIHVGFFGRFAWSKGPDLLLQASELLRAEGLDVRCELAGPIAERESRWAWELFRRHSDHAVYRGTLHDDALRQWLRGLALVVVPSRTLETGPLTLLEAWDEEVPVIGTGLGGIQEFLDGAGLGAWTFEANSASSLAAAIRRGMDRPVEERPEVQVPGMVEMGERMAEIYEQIQGRSAVTAAGVSASVGCCVEVQEVVRGHD
jgi:glycosyltransferase involved in cell wall biosynthesis